MRRHEPEYERLRASEIHDTTGKDPNEYRDLACLWDVVQDAVDGVHEAFSENTEQLQQSLLQLHVSFSCYTLRQGVFINRTVLEKYPGHCPYCQYAECICSRVKQGQAQRNPIPLSQLFEPEHIRPETAQRMLVRIYGQANTQRTAEQLWQAVLSELTEVAEWVTAWQENGNQLSQAEAKMFHFELADTMARIYALLDRVGIDIGDTLHISGGPPYQGTLKPRIKLATNYTPLPKLID